MLVSGTPPLHHQAGPLQLDRRHGNVFFLNSDFLFSLFIISRLASFFLCAPMLSHRSYRVLL